MSSSSRGLATLCSAGSWQCEGSNVLCSQSTTNLLNRVRLIEQQDPASMLGAAPLGVEDSCSARWPTDKMRVDEDTHADVWNYTTALDEWSSHWDLRKPVLLETTPSQWLRITSMIRGVLASRLPTRMHVAGIRALEPRVIMLWRPWCLAMLSTHALEAVHTRGRTSWATEELQAVAKLASKHRSLTGTLGVRVLVVSFADLLWDGNTTAARVQAFLPELGALDLTYTPKMGVDIFPGNGWKPPGSEPLLAFSRAHPPNKLGYDDVTRRCRNAEQVYALIESERQREVVKSAEEYLRRLSI